MGTPATNKPTNRHAMLKSTAVVLVLASASPRTSHAQVRFQLTGGIANINGDCCANETTFTPPLPALAMPQPCAVVGLTPGLLGNDFGIRCFAQAHDQDPGEILFMDAQIKARAFINGDNTRAITMQWLNLALCQSFDDPEMADANMNLGFTLQWQIVDPAAPPGTPVIVYYSWDAFGGASTDHECDAMPPPPDPNCPPALNQEDMVCSTNTLQINNIDVLAGRFNLGSGTQFDNCNQLPFGAPNTCPNGLPGFNKKTNQSGVIWSAVGNNVLIALSSNVEAHMRSPIPPVAPLNVTRSDAIFLGMLRMTVGYPPPPPLPPPLPLQVATFSIDIGSDREDSDSLPLAGPRLFDPGDCYLWGGPPVLCVPNGLLDDASIFLGNDPPPLRLAGPPPVCASIISGAPLCSGVWNPSDYFDLDGHDTLDVSLASALGSNLGPIPFFTSNCIDGTDHLAISFDDDRPEHYSGPACEVPARSYSPYLNTIFGTTAARDEVVGIETIPLLSPPLAIPLTPYPIADEVMVHLDLTPNPGNTNNQDDDVDSLDMVVDPTICTSWYFTCDHEATRFDPINGISLDPGVIYLAGPAGPVPIVNPALHLGLLPGVDLGDFEFAWLYNDAANAIHLVLLFCVHVDDPLTPMDESAGLDPRMVYASFMNGASFPFLTAPPSGEAIDAIATWRNDLSPPINTGACCQASGACTVMDQFSCASVPGNVFRGAGTDCADVNQDGAADICECLFCRGDLNGDGTLDGRDVSPFVNCYVAGIGANCGCADMNASGGTLSPADIALFVTALLQWPAFPCL